VSQRGLAGAAPPRPRLQAIDAYRGLAILAMAAYHLCWDLNYYRIIEVGIGVDPVWISAQRTILTAFLLLAGASLALAHSAGIRWPGFWRREAIIVAAALAVSAGTWFAFGEYFAYFGVLHAIALFSLMALPFVRWPLWAGSLTTAAFLFLPAVYSSDLFDPRWLNWLGFFRQTPETADLVPVFHWFGVVLIGLLATRLFRAAPAFTWASSNRAVRVLRWMGRWSLIIYLVHQPLLFGLVTPIANYLQTAEQAKLESFTQSCQQSCSVNNSAPFCTSYCSCALDLTVRENLWNAGPADLGRVNKLCTFVSK
jgi:uncharacterized membrane protein